MNTSDPNYSNALNQQRSFISSLLTEAHPQALGLQRNRGTVGAVFSPSLHWNYGVEYFRENRDGFRPYGATLGFSWLQELPEEIDYNTDRVRAGLEYANNGRTFNVAYEFSGFNNEFPVMTWDNPFRLTDRAEQSAGDGTSRGRLQLPTDNHSNMISLSGTTDSVEENLPELFRTIRGSLIRICFHIQSIQLFRKSLCRHPHLMVS